MESRSYMIIRIRITTPSLVILQQDIIAYVNLIKGLLKILKVGHLPLTLKKETMLRIL